MDHKLKGAWIVNHSAKLKNVTNAENEFEQINFAGKTGLLLSSLAADNQHKLETAKVEALARASNINRKTELPAILDELDRQKLISKGSGGIEVIGLSSSHVLSHIGRIFDESDPDKTEIAAIELAEKCSDSPISESDAREYIADTYKITSEATSTLFNNSECIGFVDTETTYNNEKLLFNGNLFRKEDVSKAHTIISTFSDVDAAKISEVNGLLSQMGCLPLNKAREILGEGLFKKVHSIALFDVNKIGNESGVHYFVTKPSAFNKFGNSVVDDAFDLAKAFVTSLAYGMRQSAYSRGRIQMISALMSKLICGEWVGPATAIGQDYQVLETKGVIKVRQEKNGRYSMKLLKKEVGSLAYSVINDGDTIGQSLDVMPSVSVTSYESPESTRCLERKNQTVNMKRNVGEILSQLRRGNL